VSDYRRVSAFFYGMVAGVYDTLDRLLFRDPERSPRAALARRVPDAGLSVLDVCSGTGAGALEIARRCPSDRALGIDLSEGMLSVAERGAAAAGLRNASFRKADATAVDLPDASFDVVATSLSLHELPPDARAAALREMRRLVVEGGRLLVVEWERPSRGFARGFFSVFPGMLERRGFHEFLDLDWGAFLADYRFELEAVERCAWTKLIIARAR